MPADKKSEKPPDKRTVLRELAQNLGRAYLEELWARKKFQDADEVRFGARTPTPEDLATIRAAKKVHQSKTRERMMIEAEMANIIGIKTDKGKPPGQVLDNADPD